MRRDNRPHIAVSRVINDLKRNGFLQVKNGRISVKESAITN